MENVLVRGIAGNMGKQAAISVMECDNFRLSAGVDIDAAGKKIDELPSLREAPSRKIFQSVERAIKEKNLNVMIDFTSAEGLLEAAETALEAGMNLIIGTTGLSENEREELAEMTESRGLSVLLAPNFSLGAVLLMELSEKAAEYFNRVEIIEGHHQGKDDAPSGTSIATAEKLSGCEKMAGENDIDFTVEGVRGGEVNNVKIHSLRLPGLVARQEVILGGEGQTLTLEHNTTSRSAFRPGIKLALRSIDEFDGFVYGLENLL